MSEEKIADFRSLSDGNDEFLKEMLDKYINNARQQLGESRRLLSNPDVEPLRRIMHSLKGATMSLGLDPLSRVVVEFEGRLKLGPVPNSVEYLDKLDTLLEDVVNFRAGFN